MLLCSGAVFLSLRKKDAEGQAGAFLAVIGILVLRDLLLAFFHVGELQCASDIFYFGFTVYLFASPYRKMRLALVAVLVLNVLAVVLYALRLYSGFAASAPLWLFSLVPVLDTLLLAANGILNSRDTENSAKRFVSVTWIIAFVALFAQAATAVVFGYDNELYSRILVPVSYTWLVFSALAGLRIQDDETLAAVSYYEESIDSLYNLSFRVGTVLKSSFSTEEVLASMNEAMISETGADGGSMYLVDEFDDIIVAKAYKPAFPPPFPLPESLPRKANRVESYMRHVQLRLGETIIGEVAKTGKNVYAPDVVLDARFTSNGEEEFLQLASFMAVPLMVEDKIIGVSAVAKISPGAQFSEADFDRYKLLANFGTLAVSNFFSFLEANEKSGIEQSAGIAAEIQRTIIPRKVPQFPTLGIGAFTTPARGVSGDYYDIIRTREDKLIGVVGDVAGKGVSAALIMVMIRSILHLVTNTDKDISTILDWVNRGITGKIDMDHYATLGIVAININTGEVEYANASHQPLLVYRRASDTMETIDIKSVPIGVERATQYQKKTLRLRDGDIAVLYTDGVVEAMNGQGKQFGRKGLSQAISRNRDQSPREIVSRIKNEVASFIGGARQHDDQTILVFKMKL
jgi:sigma-B regulation protein RsbU (phosphoserine phosphatase)